MKTDIDFLIECSESPDYGYLKWNKWRKDNKIVTPNLENAKLNGIALLNYDFTNANFKGATLKNAKLIDCRFIEANLEDVNLEKSNCSFSHFTEAILNNINFNHSDLTYVTIMNCQCKNALFINASLTQSILNGSDFLNTDFSNSKIVLSNLVDCNLQKTKFVNCYLNGSNISRSNLENSIIKETTIYGISAWDITLKDCVQENLIVTNHYHDSTLTVDDIEIANFIYLMSNNDKISKSLDSITTKIVLILGRFTPERLKILKYIKELLKKRNFVPVLFDFEKPAKKDLTETIGLIGRMSKFVIADLTDAKSIPQELSELIPNNPNLTIYPIVSIEHREYAMFEHWKHYPWVKETFKYKNELDLDEYFE